MIARGLLQEWLRRAADVVAQKAREVVVVARRRDEAAQHGLDQLGIRPVGRIEADRIAEVLEPLGPVELREADPAGGVCERGGVRILATRAAEQIERGL